MKLKAILFDVLGTVVDMSSAQSEDLQNYLEHIQRPQWSPLVLPRSWELFPAFADAWPGLSLLRTHFTVVTCSNPPLGFLLRLSKNAGLRWDGIVPLELAQVYKTNPAAYRHVADVVGCDVEECAMVTANEKFGDLEAARSIGMSAYLIDRRRKYVSETRPMPTTVLQLAQKLVQQHA